MEEQLTVRAVTRMVTAVPPVGRESDGDDVCELDGGIRTGIV